VSNVMPRTAEFTKLSSHVIGSDQVGRRVDVQPEAQLEGIYGSSGFYFQVGIKKWAFYLSLVLLQLQLLCIYCVGCYTATAGTSGFKKLGSN
jgi:hypothetical protein